MDFYFWCSFQYDTMRFLYIVLFIIILSPFSEAQFEPRSGADVLHELRKLQNPARVLYIAAHPDDENTRMISWLANGKGCETAYLSLTRGDGGQNLIGKELGVELGVLRTQELMQARSIDGGRQFFSRAVDFGYSKSDEETLEKWGEDEVLSDVVWVIRKFRPDVIITRFPPDARAGHGHHTASAKLAIKAFNSSDDVSIYPEQLKYVDPWRAKRIYWNSSIWWNRKLDSIAKADPKFVTVDIGGYDAVTGTSYNELGSLSRTQHKSQGFGVSVSRGSQKEYLMHLDGDMAKEDLFEGVQDSWSDYGFVKGDKLIARAANSFNPMDPGASVPVFMELRNAAIESLPPFQRNYFVEKLDRIILWCTGLHIEVRAGSEYVVPGQPLSVSFEALTRGTVEVGVEKVSIMGSDHIVNKTLDWNQTFKKELDIELSSNYSQPYWLEKPFQNLFEVGDQQMIGMAENPDPFDITVDVLIDGTRFNIPVSMTYKYSDRVEGEIVKKVMVVPELVVDALGDNLVFVDQKPKEFELQVRFFGKAQKELNISAKNWVIEPSSILLKSDEAGETQNFKISVTPTSKSKTSQLELVTSDGTIYGLSEINYDHIERKVVLNDPGLKLIKLDLKKNGELVGYIPGAGDKVADAIELMGYKVEILDEQAIRDGDLSKYKAIIAGIRAYNTRKWLPGYKTVLMDYVRQGGNYIVQYNTRSRDLLTTDIGPYPFEISRKRVTMEDARTEMLLKDHPVLNVPNRLNEEDFENWVQERGLYFGDNWSKEYQTPLGWSDKGEGRLDGGLLFTPYGKGAFVYTGISFFRELPAGVTGAYRLLANLISYKSNSGDEQ